MTQEFYYAVFATSAGWMGILGSPQGLFVTTLPCPSAEEARRMLGDRVTRAACPPDSFNDLIERFQRYFTGQPVDFPDRLDLSAGTLFQRRVWETARNIPYGETRSYAWIARQMGKPRAMRAVGQALGRNPLPIIVPCHRVVAGDGGLGGFTGGIAMKINLLKLEGSRTY